MTRRKSVVIDDESFEVVPLSLQDRAFRPYWYRNAIVDGAVKPC